MPTPKKADTIEELTELLRTANLAVVTDYRGLNVSAITQLRRNLRGMAELHVTKNTLMTRAAQEAGVPQLLPLLEGPTAVAFVVGEDIAGSIRAINDFVRTSRILRIKGALFGPSIVPEDRVAELINIPTRPQLMGQIVGSVQGPLNNLVGTLNQLLSQVAYALQAYADQQQGGEAESAPAAVEAVA